MVYKNIDWEKRRKNEFLREGLAIYISIAEFELCLINTH